MNHCFASPLNSIETLQTSQTPWPRQIQRKAIASKSSIHIQIPTAGLRFMSKAVWNSECMYIHNLVANETNVTLNLDASIRGFDEASVADCYLRWKHLSCNRFTRLPALEVPSKKAGDEHWKSERAVAFLIVRKCLAIKTTLMSPNVHRKAIH